MKILTTENTSYNLDKVPETADEVMSASVNYQQEILAAADSVQKIIESIPPEQRLVITTHDALSYFARSFGMQVRTLQGA